MPRPKTKTDLLDQARKEHDLLDECLAGLSDAQYVETDIVGAWSVKDVLAHLTEWEQMALGWHAADQRGEQPEMPANGYKWNQTPELNQQIYEKHRERPLHHILADYRASYAEIIAFIKNMPEENLFTPSYYDWTGNNNMATYYISATSSHYRWARNEIRKGFRRKQQ